MQRRRVVAASVSAPNIADLILAMKTQAKVETNDSMAPNYVLMNYATEFKMRTLKNTLGDYITVLPNGALSVHGMTIIPTPKLSASELVVLDSTTLQLHDKRNITMEIERVPETDSYRLWLWYLRTGPRYAAGYEGEYLCRRHQHRSGRHRESNSRTDRVTHESER